MSLFAITAVSANRPCRVRLYESEYAAYTDFQRPVTEPPQAGTQHGVVFDINFDQNPKSASYYWKLTPIALTTKDPKECKLVVEPPTDVHLESQKVA